MKQTAAADVPRYGMFSKKHLRYMGHAMRSSFCVAEGAVRAGKTIDHCFIAACCLERCADTFHLATGSTIGNAKLNIGVCNGFGLENLFRGRSHWGKYRDNEALFIRTQTGEKIVIFAGGGKADSYKRILGNSYGLWIATEINEHYDCDDSRTSFIKVAMARQAAAQEPLTLWDLNPSSPKARIYTEYIDRYRDEAMPGYLYEHFTIHDNATLSEEQRAAFIAKYRKDSVWYRRDILGERVIAEGLIYRAFADHPEQWAVTSADLRAKYYDKVRKRWNFQYLNLGVDFGGNGSLHAFVAVAITEDWHVIVLKARRIPAKDVPVEVLTNRFLAFAEEIRKQYGEITASYCDSAEQAIIATFRRAADFPIANALKGEIIDRIRATELLMTSGFLSYVEGDCDSLVTAWSEAVWDDKDPGTWARLDDGSTDIDSNDAWEYSIERFIPSLIQMIEKGVTI